MTLAGTRIKPSDSPVEEACRCFYTEGPREPVILALIATFHPWIGQLKNIRLLPSVQGNNNNNSGANNVNNGRDLVSVALVANPPLKLALSNGGTPLTIPAEVAKALPVFENLIKESTLLPWTTHFINNICLPDVIQDPFFKSSITSDQKSKFQYFLLETLLPNESLSKGYFRASIAKVLSLVSESAWHDSDAIQNFHLNVIEKASVREYLITLTILIELVELMKAPSKSSSIQSRHRKMVNCFRDYHLLSIFKFCLKILDCSTSEYEASSSSNSNATTASATSTTNFNFWQQVNESNMKLILSILSFDFMGAAVDESSDDIGSIQIPHGWKSLFEDEKMLSSFFRGYCVFPPPFSSMTLQAVVYLACVRRSLFSSSQKRNSFIDLLLAGTLEIVTKGVGLAHESNYHECCRFLANFKNCYQLNEILDRDLYPTWIEAVKDFCFKSFHSGSNISKHSLIYILTFWSKLVGNYEYSRGSSTKQHLLNTLETSLQQVFEEFTKSRMNMIANTSVDISSDVMEEFESMTSQSDLLVPLFLIKPDATMSFFANSFSPMIDQYRLMVERNTFNLASEQSLFNIHVMETQICWMICFSSGILNSSSGYNSRGRQEDLNSEMAAMIFKFFQSFDQLKVAYMDGDTLSKSALSSPYIQSKVKLELALLSYFNLFRKNFVAQTSNGGSTSFYALLSMKLGATAGLMNSQVFLEALVKRLFTTLHMWANESSVVNESLELFNDICNSTGSSRILLKLDFTRMLLERSTASDLAFLNLSQNFKSRTVFYAAFAKLFFSLDDDNPFMFDSFLRPFHATIESLKSTGDLETFRSSKFRMTLIGLLRDLRGVLQSLTIKARVYTFMQWICGYQHLDFFEAVMKNVGSDDTEIMIPMLRFYNELICNRSARLAYDKDYNYSFYGTLIRSVASFVDGYTALMAESVKANNVVNENELYFKRYKPIHITLSIIKFWLANNVLALGLFTYFGTDQVSAMIHNTFKLVEGIPISEMLSYPKFSSAYFAAIEVICTHTWYYIPTNLDFKNLEYMVESMGSVIMTSDANSVSSACVALACILSQTITMLDYGNGGAGHQFLVKPSLISHQNNETNHPFLVFLVQTGSSSLSFLLQKILSRLMMEDCTSQWTLSQPLYPLLILMDDKILEEIVNDISRVESEFGARLVRNAFGQLRRAVTERATEDVRYVGLKSPLLSSKNRSAFTDAVCSFRRQLSDREEVASEASGLMSATGANHGSGLFGSDGAITAMSD